MSSFDALQKGDVRWRAAIIQEERGTPVLRVYRYVITSTPKHGLVQAEACFDGDLDGESFPTMLHAVDDLSTDRNTALRHALTSAQRHEMLAHRTVHFWEDAQVVLKDALQGTGT